MTSSVMLQTLHDKGLETSIITQISKEQLKVCGFAFVDDSDIITDADYAHSLELTMERIQTIIDLGFQGSIWIGGEC